MRAHSRGTCQTDLAADLLLLLLQKQAYREMAMWERAYREEATITNAEKPAKQEKQHRTIVSLQV